MSREAERIPSSDTMHEDFTGWVTRFLLPRWLWGRSTPREASTRSFQGQSHGDSNLRILSQAAFVAALGGAFVATPTLAAPFDGPYVGAQVGWQSEKMRDVKSSVGTIPVDDRKDSITGGVFVGYDATINGRFDMAMKLMDKGADVKLANDANATPLYTVINTQWAPKSL